VIFLQKQGNPTSIPDKRIDVSKVLPRTPLQMAWQFNPNFFCLPQKNYPSYIQNQGSLLVKAYVSNYAIYCPSTARESS
jgi:hypothetical protein